MTDVLNPLDAAFLLLETPGSSMRIGAVIELEMAPEESPAEAFARIRGVIEERIHEIPVLRAKVVRAPFDLAWPTLRTDASFDLARHVIRAAVPQPGDAREVDSLISRFLSQPLAPDRPLWQLLVVEGSANGRLVVVLKIHHALADGVSGAETFAGLFDISPEVRPATPTVDPSYDGPTTPLAFLLERVVSTVVNPLRIVSALSSWARRIAVVSSGLGRFVAAQKVRGPGLQPSIFAARRCALNATPDDEKVYRRTRVPLAKFKTAAKSRGSSVTNLVMAVMGGALETWLAERGTPAPKGLIAFVPINVRGAGAGEELGNRISGMLVDLHVGATDREERLSAISTDAGRTLSSQREERAQIFEDVPRLLGPTVLSVGHTVISALDLFDHFPPMANVMISSVPGPPVALWLAGHRVVSACPVGPLFASLALNVTVLGFEDSLEVGFFASSRHLPDLDDLVDRVDREIAAFLDSAPTS